MKKMSPILIFLFFTILLKFNSAQGQCGAVPVGGACFHTSVTILLGHSRPGVMVLLTPSLWDDLSDSSVDKEELRKHDPELMKKIDENWQLFREAINDMLVRLQIPECQALIGSYGSNFLTNMWYRNLPGPYERFQSFVNSGRIYYMAGPYPPESEEGQKVADYIQIGNEERIIVYDKFFNRSAYSMGRVLAHEIAHSYFLAEHTGLNFLQTILNGVTFTTPAVFQAREFDKMYRRACDRKDLP